MYDYKFVVAIKSNDKVLREFEDKVYIPYGTEYSILLKNLNSVRAIVKITIDDTEVVPGGLVINGNSEINLERFVNDMSKGNKFQFIERTKNIENYRGIKANDGLIRVEFQYEKLFNTVTPYYLHYTYYPPNYGNISTSSMEDYRGSVTCSASPINTTNQVGITVPGNISHQKFSYTTSFPVELETHIIVLQLLGETEQNKEVIKPITIKQNLKCQTCGKVNKINSNFCNRCGTSLTII